MSGYDAGCGGQFDAAVVVVAAAVVGEDVVVGEGVVVVVFVAVAVDAVVDMGHSEHDIWLATVNAGNVAAGTQIPGEPSCPLKRPRLREAKAPGSGKQPVLQLEPQTKAVNELDPSHPYLRKKEPVSAWTHQYPFWSMVTLGPLPQGVVMCKQKEPGEVVVVATGVVVDVVIVVGLVVVVVVGVVVVVDVVVVGVFVVVDVVDCIAVVVVDDVVPA
jgi:hypothetical protein